ncbi:acyl-CoA dehydrogenase family protein [Rhodococcus sp. MSC1_016]|jgi:alkylation response protein AidB-like acyl-CoA dehydrogenase|uniref:acyl-CoA dehydrogenase family protein n=1 Tax=Rhodococcus sp. MSC1_016 TaxID=2909266 RepID=UPI00202E2F60|nr:acyl-CoA dehydrogenase family protein [Rhodococcus sp. MSC1_016]
MTFDLSLTDEQTAIQELVSSLALEVLDPAAHAAEKAQAIPESVLRTLHATGLVAPVDVEYGGGGVPDALSQLLVAEGLAYGDAAMTVSMLWNGSAAVIIGICGTEAQRTTYLPAFASNPLHRAGLALYEGYGRAPSEYQTTIVREGDGYRVRGQKVAVQLPSDGAPLIVVGVDPTTQRLRAAIIEPGAYEGQELGLRPSGTQLGLDAVPTVSADMDVLIPETAILGSTDADRRLLSTYTSIIRLCAAAAAVGCARRAVEYAAKYATERIAFERPIASFQGIAFLIADAHIKIEASWLQIRQTLTMVTQPATADPERAVSHVVGYACTAASEVTRDCVQVLGGHGFLTDHPVERWYRATASLAALDLDPTCQAFAPAL